MTYPSLDPEEQAILAALNPEGAEPGSPATDVPTEEGDTSAQGSTAPAPAPAGAPAAEPAPAPAATAAAPAPTEAPAPAAAAAAPAAPAAAPQEQQPQGDPRAALRASRRQERLLRDQLAEANRQLEEARKAAPSAGASTSVADMTEEQLAELEENFPIQAQLVREVRELRKTQAAAAAPAPAATPEWEAPAFAPQVQEVIDQVGSLQAWQYSQADQPKFQMAVEFDQSLMHDPVWKHKPVVERFAEAARRTQEAFAAKAPAASAPAPTRQDPNAVIAAAATRTPAGIGDFRGGGPASAPALDFSKLSDEQILHSLTPEP